MLKVDNKKAITKLANNSFKANKLRNIFAIAAIVLTTVMFTTLFTVGMSMKASLEESTMRQSGGSAHGSFKYLSQDEYDKLRTHKIVEEMEYSIILGVAEN
ncbi:MAG: ABC transporter permease, partial [Clostridium sp.]